MRKHRISILANYPLPGREFEGGVETATAALLDGLRQFLPEFQFDLVTLAPHQERDSRVEDRGIPIHYVSAPLRGAARPRTLLAALRAIEQVKNHSPDLVHVQGNMQLGVAALRLRVPAVFAIHGIPSRERAIWSGPAYAGVVMESCLQRIVFRRYSRFISVSPVPPITLLPHQRCTYIPNAVRSQFLADNGRRGESRTKLLFVGRLTTMKGFDTLSAAFRTLREEFRDLELAVVGTPLAGEGPRPEQTADGSGIIYHGSQNADGIKRLMAESLLLVLPSLQENSPLVIAEAAAMGLPSAATRVGGIPAMIEDGVTGFLLEPGSADCLTRTLHEALHNRPRLIQMGMAAQQRCLAEYSPHAVASKTITLYRQMLQEPERQ